MIFFQVYIAHVHAHIHTACTYCNMHGGGGGDGGGGGGGGGGSSSGGGIIGVLCLATGIL